MPVAVLQTVANYVDETRSLIQDKVEPHRYDDQSIVRAINLAMSETARLRPDLFLGRRGIRVPQFEQKNGEELDIELQFQMAIVFATAGFTLLRDDEDVNDARAASYMTSFHDILIGVRPGPVTGGNPGPSSPQK